MTVGDWANGMSIAAMAERLTPKQAARLKYQAAFFRPADPGSRVNALIDGNAAHRWFLFCLDAVARRE